MSKISQTRMSQPGLRLYAFGPFRLDPRERVLSRGGQPVPLTPKQTATLLALVERHGHIVEKSDLIQRVWADTAVEESNLTQNIYFLRKVLGDGGGGRFIETVPRRGYRFAAPVEEVWGAPSETENVSALASEATSAGTDPGLLRTRRTGRKKRMSLAGVVGLLLPGVALLGIATYRFAWPRPHATREPFLRISTERLTESGRATGAAISLDGKYIVHAIEEGGPQRLWLRHLATSSSVPITPSDEVEYWGLSFSPDGGHVYYVARKLAETDGRLLRIPTLGGVPQVVPIQAAISSTVSFAPDGRQMAYLGGPGALGSQLIVSSADGGDERVLATRQHPEPFSMHLSGPAWSPDGRIIVCAAAVPGSEGRYKQLVAVRADDGAQRPFGPRRWLNIGRLAWLPDGSGLLITANDQPWSPWQIWHVSYPAGDARRITNDVNDYRDLSLTADARTLIAVQAQRMGGLWVVPDGRHELARRITSEVGNYGGIAGISWTPDGKIVHRTRAAGHWDISMMEPDGSRQRRLTVDPAADLHPSVSLDGRYLVFSSNRRGSFDIWRTDLLGDQAVRLTGEGDEVYPRITPDGRWVIYQQGFRWFARLTLWKVPIEGGDPVALSPRFAMRPAISPDGKLVAFYHMEHGKWRLGVMSADGGNILKSFDDPGSLSRVVQWTPDGKSLAYVFGRGGVSNIWAQPLDGSAPAQITQFRSQEILDFSWSPDGRMLACVRGLDSSDLVRIGWE